MYIRALKKEKEIWSARKTNGSKKIQYTQVHWRPEHLGSGQVRSGVRRLVSGSCDEIDVTLVN